MTTVTVTLPTWLLYALCALVSLACVTQTAAIVAKMRLDKLEAVKAAYQRGVAAGSRNAAIAGIARVTKGDPS